MIVIEICPRIADYVLHALLSPCVLVCVNLSIERRPVCDSNPDWAAALIRIQPRGTSRPSR